MPINRTHKTVPTASDYANLSHITDSLNTINALLDAVTDRTDGKMTSLSATVGDGSGSGDAGDRSWVLQVTDTVKKLLKWKQSTGRMRLEDEAGTLIPLEVAEPSVSTQAATKGYVDTVATAASQAQAEAGTNNTAVMTPLRVAQAINALSPFDYLGTSGAIAAGQGQIMLNTAGWFDSTTEGVLLIPRHLRPQTDGVNMWMQTYTDGGTTPIATSSDFINNGRNSADAAKTNSSASQSQLVLNMGDSIGNASNETWSGIILLLAPNASEWMPVFWLEGYLNTGTVFQGGMGAGMVRNTTAKNALRLLFSSGNYAAGGEVTAYRVRKQP